MRRRVHFLVEGRVQGVAFRASAYERALELNIAGWVRNRADGTVEGTAEGVAEAVDAFLVWCAKGPPGARVDRIGVADEAVRGELSRFQIRR